MITPKQLGRSEAIGDSAGALALTNRTETYRAITVNQTTAAQTLTLPAPTDTSIVFAVDVLNIGTADFIMYGQTITPGSSQRIAWNGTAFGAIQSSAEPTWINSTATTTAVDDDQILVGAGHTINMPASPTAGDSVKLAPANGDWDTLGATLATTDTATFMNGQVGIISGADVLQVVYDAGADNWIGFLGSGSNPIMVGADGVTAGSAGAVPAPTATENLDLLTGAATFTEGSYRRLDQVMSTIVAVDIKNVDNWYINVNADGTIPDPSGTGTGRQVFTITMVVFGTTARVVTLPTGINHIDKDGNVITTVNLSAGTTGTRPSSTVFNVVRNGTNWYWAEISANDGAAANVREYGFASPSVNQEIVPNTPEDWVFGDQFFSSGITSNAGNTQFTLPANSGVYEIRVDAKFTTLNIPDPFINWAVVTTANAQYANQSLGNVVFLFSTQDAVQSQGSHPCVCYIDTSGGAQTFKVRNIAGTGGIFTVNINAGITSLTIKRVD